MADVIEELLQATLEDGRMSRKERRQVRALVREAGLNSDQLSALRARAFDLARATTEPEEALDWLEDVLRAIEDARRPERDATIRGDAYFSPSLEPKRAIIGLLDSARKRADICVFTITDNEIAAAILRTHQRGIQVRLITDNDKATDRGSDIDRLAASGVPVAEDRTDAHMHHKFALFDSHTLLSGSYNWTRSAARENEENIIVTDHPRLVSSFQREFDALWRALA